MSARLPSIRASQVKANVESLRELGDDAERRVRAALRPDLLAAVEEESGVAWIPVAVDIELTEAVATVLGRDALTRWSQSAIRKSMQRPLLKPFVDGAIRVFGLTPVSLMKLAPRAWLSIYKDCGHLEVSAAVEERSAQIEIVDAAEPILGSPDYQRGIAVSLAAAFIVMNVTGEIVVRPPSPGSDRRVVFGATWQPASQPA